MSDEEQEQQGNYDDDQDDGNGPQRPAGYENEDDGDGDGEDDDDDLMFSCSMDNAKAITTMLLCLSHGNKKAQHAQVEVAEDSITFIVCGRAKFTQAQGTMKKELFSAFHCEDDGGRFTINLTTLLDCLQIFGPGNLAQTGLSMSYHPSQAVFKLTLEDAGVFTSCEITALHQDEDQSQFAILAAAFRDSPEVCRCILKSAYLKEAFQELTDLPGAGSIRVLVSQTAPYFQLSTQGNLGSFEVEFPKTSETFVHFECEVAQISWAYQLLAIESGMKALASAHETYFRINTQGIMCIQHQIPMLGGQHSFVDFLICADELDGDREEGEDGDGEGNGRTGDDGDGADGQGEENCGGGNGSDGHNQDATDGRSKRQSRGRKSAE